MNHDSSVQKMEQAMFIQGPWLIVMLEQVWKFFLVKLGTVETVS